MGEVRNPIKKSSIAKKEKIIKTCFELMCDKGYHNVTCIDIAKEAGVSTGIIYQYFNDKRDIFIEGVKDYANNIMFPMINILDNEVIDKNNIKDILTRIIDSFINTHKLKKEAHEELMAMSYLDNDIASIFNDNEMLMTEKISKILVNSGFDSTNIEEKVHISIGIIDNYCHEVVYHKHKDLNYDIMKEKVILAYSGGLDTTAIIPWLKENFDYEVICVCIDCGQEEELDGLEERAISCGASKLYILDVNDELCDEYIVPCVQAHAVYENKYLLGTSMARPLIAKKLVEVARKEGATAICHGATGKGNDQIRFELGIKALAPDLKIIAAWRNDKWTMDSRESEIEYCQAHGIHLPFSADSSYSRDRNIWHISHEGLELEDPANEPNYGHLLVLGCTPEEAPDEAEYVTMTFEKGVPKSVNGVEMKVSDIIRTLNKLGAKHGIGIVDIVENRVVGMKSRGVYETPGGTILMEAHQQLEELILDRDTYAEKIDMGNKMAQIVYEGKWFTPLREAVQAFIESTQKYVTGEVKFKLYKGNIIKQGTTSPYSIYDEDIASFTTGELYNHKDAEGFINLFGLSSKVRAMKLGSFVELNDK